MTERTVIPEAGGPGLPPASDAAPGGIPQGVPGSSSGRARRWSRASRSSPTTCRPMRPTVCARPKRASPRSNAAWRLPSAVRNAPRRR